MDASLDVCRENQRFRSHADFFCVCVFRWLLEQKYMPDFFFFFFLSRRNISPGIYILALGSTPYGKKAYLPNQTYKSSAVYLRRKLTFTAIFLVLTTNQFDAFFNPKNASDRNATNSARPTWKTYEVSRRRRCLTLIFGDNANHSHSDRCQPLTTVKARASQRSFTS